jgi:hypothetical protein
MRIYLIGIFLALLIPTAKAEMQFPAYSSLSPEQQKAWGYKVDIFVGQNYHNGWINVWIPPKAAKYCHDARILFRDKQKKLLSLINAGLIKGKDGSLSIHVELMSAFADAELILYTDSIPGADLPAGVLDFGGFTFDLTTKP